MPANPPTNPSDVRSPYEPPSRPTLRAALGFGTRPAAAAGANGATGTSATAGGSSGAAGSAGAEDAAAGLGVDEYVDPLGGPGRDASRHADMKHLPGNALNMVEMVQLRERNHVLIQQAARRTGDRRTVRLDSVGLELIQQMQRSVERAHFSQAATSIRSKPADVSEERFALTRPDDIRQRRDEPPVDVWQADAPLPDEADVPLGSDPDRPMTSVASERAALQREALLELCAEAHGEAMAALALLNQAEGLSSNLRSRQSTGRDAATPLNDSALELQADSAEQFEASARHQFEVSNARAVQLAGAVQGRRIGLNNMLKDKAPRAPR